MLVSACKNTLFIGKKQIFSIKSNDFHANNALHNYPKGTKKVEKACLYQFFFVILHFKSMR